jgi:hypothetical protein
MLLKLPIKLGLLTHRSSPSQKELKSFGVRHKFVDFLKYLLARYLAYVIPGKNSKDQCLTPVI